jgi:hypothetical protein
MLCVATDQRMLYDDITKQRIQRDRVLFQFLDHDRWGLQWYPINRILWSLNNDITEKTYTYRHTVDVSMGNHPYGHQPEKSFAFQAKHALGVK